MRASYGAVLLAVALAGCASKIGTEAPAAGRGAATVAHPVTLSYGTILAERRVPGGEGNGGTGTMGGVSGGDIRATILTAVDGQAVSQPEGAMPDGATEFIVRVDDGRTISVIQGNALGLRRGARVMIIHGAQTRLAPAAQP